MCKAGRRPGLRPTSIRTPQSHCCSVLSMRIIGIQAGAVGTWPLPHVTLSRRYNFGLTSGRNGWEPAQVSKGALNASDTQATWVRGCPSACGTLPSGISQGTGGNSIRVLYQHLRRHPVLMLRIVLSCGDEQKSNMPSRQKWSVGRLVPLRAQRDTISPFVHLQHQSAVLKGPQGEAGPTH